MYICKKPNTLQCKKYKVGISPDLLGCTFEGSCPHKKTKSEIQTELSSELNKAGVE